jgi:hypothetical protein
MTFNPSILKAEMIRSVGLLALILLAPYSGYAQTRDSGPWWPSPHGSADQAGASNYVTPQKILAALQLPRTGQTYESRS